MINSHRVEISIAGGAEEMVRDLNPLSFFCFLFFLFFIICFVLISDWEQRLCAALAMVDKQTPSPMFYPPRH